MIHYFFPPIEGDKGQVGRGHLFFFHVTAQEMSGRASFPWDRLTHDSCHQGQLYCASWMMMMMMMCVCVWVWVCVCVCRGQGLSLILQLGKGRVSSPALMASCFHGLRTSSPMMPRLGVGAILHSHQTSTFPRAATQTRDIYRAFGGNKHLLLQGQRPICGPWCQHRPGPHHDPKWHHWLLTSGCSGVWAHLRKCFQECCVPPMN